MIPAPDATYGVTTTVNTIVNGITSFFSGAWPVLVAAMLLILLALVVMRFGFTGVRRFIRLGR